MQVNYSYVIPMYYIALFAFQSSYIVLLLSNCSLGEAQVESLLSVGDEEGRIGLSFLQSQAASPGLYSLLRCRAGDLTKVQRPPLSLVQLIQCCALIGRGLLSGEIFSCTERSYYRRS